MESFIEDARKQGQQVLQSLYRVPVRDHISFIAVRDAHFRKQFDFALDELHYAKSCQRVGRCMRLAVVRDGLWVGGIVLGSTFPNIHVRDEALGLKKFVRDIAARGLTNAWSGRNKEYWCALQTIVNHARTFIFPYFQGRGLGKEAHKFLLTAGLNIWEKTYSDRVYALDTLCDHSDSGLFLSNGWHLAGETKGYTADYNGLFSSRKRPLPAINNAALKPGQKHWQVWVRVVRPSLRPE